MKLFFLLAMCIAVTNGVIFTEDFNTCPDRFNGIMTSGINIQSSHGRAKCRNSQLKLQSDNNGQAESSWAYVAIPAVAGSSEGWTMSFDYKLRDKNEEGEPAEGFSVNYGSGPFTRQAGAAFEYEEGLTVSEAPNNIAFEVDVHGGERGTAISCNIGGVHLANDHDANAGPLMAPDTNDNNILAYKSTGSMSIGWHPVNGAVFKSQGLVTEANFENVPTTGFVGDENYYFIFAARTSSNDVRIDIDNIVINTIGTGTIDLINWDTRCSGPEYSAVPVNGAK